MPRLFGGRVSCPQDVHRRGDDDPFERPRFGAATPQEFRVQIVEAPDYYTLRNDALDFLYNRFAHDNVGQIPTIRCLFCRTGGGNRHHAS
ncbi:MAG: hypothetical protein AAFW84_32690 [Cyanobacteria bacterium J06635_15]